MTEVLTRLFGVDEHLTIAPESARTLVVFAYGFVLLRVAGRRLFGKWWAVDITASMVIGSNLSRTITGNAPLVGTLVALTLLMALHWLVSHVAARSRRSSAILERTPTDLITNGRIDENARRRSGISHADLDEALRGSGSERIDEVARLTIEPSGKITTRKKPRRMTQAPN